MAERWPRRNERTAKERPKAELLPKGLRARTLRKRAKRAAIEAAGRIGKSGSHVSRAERGIIEFTADELAKLAELYECDVALFDPSTVPPWRKRFDE